MISVRQLLWHIALSILFSIILMVVSSFIGNEILQVMEIFIMFEVCHVYAWFIWFKQIAPADRQHFINNSYPFKGVDRR